MNLSLNFLKNISLLDAKNYNPENNSNYLKKVILFHN